MDKYNISIRPSPDELIQMRKDYKLNPLEWIKQALDKNIDITKILEIIVNVSKKEAQLYNAFFTPDSLSNKIFDISGIYQNLSYQSIMKKKTRILEFSGGVGNIIYNLLDDLNKEYYKYIEIDFIEINEEFFNIAKVRLDKYKDIINFYNIDFFNFKNKYEYDYIIGNPPFKIKNQDTTIYDVDFYNKSWEMLKEDGSMLIIMSPSSLTLNTKSHIKFKQLLPETDKKELINSGYLYINDEKFNKKEKGVKAGLTNIETYFFKITKEEQPEEPAKDLNVPANIIQNAIRQKRARNELKNKQAEAKTKQEDCPKGKEIKQIRFLRCVNIPKVKELTEEKELIKKIGKTIPNDLIYDINEDIDNLEKIKNKKQKEKDIKDILNELDESDKIAKQILNETKSKIKKDKVLLFIEYNNKRIQLFNDYINKEPIQPTIIEEPIRPTIIEEPIRSPLVKKPRGRPPSKKKEKEIELFPKLTPELKELKKYIGSLIEPSRIYNIDWVINNIEKSGNSYDKKKGDAEQELDYFKEIYIDVSNRKNENLKSKTKLKIDKYLEFEKNRIDKITEYISKLNQIIFNIKEQRKLQKVEPEPKLEEPKALLKKNKPSSLIIPEFKPKKKDNLIDYEIPKTLDDAIKKINSIKEKKENKLNLIFIINNLYYILDNKDNIKKEILSLYYDVNKEIKDFNEELLVRTFKKYQINISEKEIIKRNDFIKIIDYYLDYYLKKEINDILELPQYILKFLTRNEKNNIEKEVKYYYINRIKDTDYYLNYRLYISLILITIKKYLD